MSDEVLFNHSAYRKNESYGKDSRRGKSLGRLLVLVNILLALTILGELLFHFLISPNLVLKKVLVESEIALSDQEILRIAGITRKEYYFSLDSAGIKSRLESYPLVRKAHVEKVFPDSLKIVLYGRRPVALTYVENEGRSIPAVLDEQGVVFQLGDVQDDLDLPVISGVRFEGATVGMKMPEMFASFLADLKNLKDASPSIFSLISELRVVGKGSGGFEVLLYPVKHQIPVRIGPEINEKLCKYIMMVLDVIDKENIMGNMDEIDFRTGEVVYRTREE